MKLEHDRCHITRGEIPSMRSMPVLYTSVKFIPDNVIYDSSEKSSVITLVEVHSNPIEQTENKAIICGVDLLRLLRLTDVQVLELSLFFS